MCWLLAFYFSYGFYGILIGVMISGVMQIILFVYYLTMKLDWKEDAFKIRKRMTDETRVTEFKE